MIDIITDQNAHIYREALTEMHRLRYEVLVGQEGWQGIEREDRLDIDEFDTPDATYFVSITDDGLVNGCGRLLKTTGPHLVSEVFSHLCRGSYVPRADNIMEFGRCVVSRDKRHGTGANVLGQLTVAELEHALAVGVNNFSMICETRFLPRLLECGWSIKMLGLPEEKDGTTIAAAIAQFDDQAVAITRERHKVFGDVSRYIGMEDPRIAYRSAVAAE